MSALSRPTSNVRITLALLFGTVACLGMSSATPPVGRPQKLSTTISIPDLQDEAVLQLSLVNKYLDTRKSYANSAKHELPRAAGMLAVIGQALAVHDSKRTAAEKAVRPPIHGPTLRDAALKLSGTKTLAEALATVPNLTTAVLGQAKPTGSIKHPWTGLISLHHIMEELNSRNSRLRRAVRRTRDPNLAARNAATMGLLGLVILSDTHEVKQKTQLAAWRKFSSDFRTNAAATARAFRAGDKAKIKPLYLQAAKACAGCHSTFRSE